MRMFAWLFAQPAERRLLGGGNWRAPTPWVIGIMSFSIMIIAAAGLALASTAGLLNRAVQARYSVELPNGAANHSRLLAVVRSAPGVTSATGVSEKEMRATLERWLGPAANSPDLPVPALVEFDLGPNGQLGPVQQRISQAAPEARVVAHGENLRPLLRSLRLLQWISLGLVVLLSGAAAAAVVLAARGALDTNRGTIEVMHGIGATDLQVTHLFQRRIALDALLGSTAGAAAAGLVLLFLAAGAKFAGELTGGATLSALDFIILLLLPLALAVIATWVARIAVLAALRRAL